MDKETNNQSGGPEKKGSKLWILIVIAVIWVAAAIWLVPLMKQAKDNTIVKDVIAMSDQVLAMDEMTQSQISDQATHTTAADLLADPVPLKGRYVVVTGAVSKDESMSVDANVARNIFSDSKWKAYILDDGVVLLDITGEGEMYPEGTVIKGYGKVFVLRLEDIWDLPYVGKDLEREFANVEGMEKQVVFHISKGITVESVPPADVADEDYMPSGKGNPCAEDNPCGDENPCGEENPCGDVNPCG